MKSAFELAYITASMFSGETRSKGVRFLYLDEIHFIEPVSIGDIVSFSSKIVYIDSNVIHIRVKATVLNSETHVKKVTNLFHFAFKLNKIEKVLYPKSYKDGIYYIDARRRHKKMELALIHEVENTLWFDNI